MNIGGAEIMLVDILNEQAKTHNVELIIINADYNIDLINTIDREVKVIFIHRKLGSRNPIPLFNFNIEILKINPDLVHFHNQNAINLLKIRYFFKTCLTVHDTNYPILNFKKYDKLFSISKAVKNDILARSNILSQVIYNGVPFDQIENFEISRKFPAFKIVQISRLKHEKKGQHILIKALGIIIHDFGIKNIQLDLIGEGDSLLFLKDLVQVLGIEVNVNFIGLKSRASIYKELKDYQLLVQPSSYEGFGLTVVEAMAAKIPVLVSNIEGPMEIIDSGRYGYYFSRGDEVDCAEKIMVVINEFSNNENSIKLFNAYNYAISNFNIQSTAKNYIDNYSII